MIHLKNIALSFCSDPKGFGTIDFGSIQVLAMGPHAMPLGELNQFGIFRRNEDLSDLSVSDTKVQGWTRVKATKAWISLAVEENRLKLLFANTTPDEPFAFAFFVKAREAEVLGRIYTNGGLQRFSGNASTVDFFASKKKVRLTTVDKGPLQIIPLGGGDHFWGADFLVAFEGCEQIKQKVFDFEKIVSYDERNT